MTTFCHFAVVACVIKTVPEGNSDQCESIYGRTMPTCPFEFMCEWVTDVCCLEKLWVAVSDVRIMITPSIVSHEPVRPPNWTLNSDCSMRRKQFWCSLWSAFFTHLRSLQSQPSVTWTEPIWHSPVVAYVLRHHAHKCDSVWLVFIIARFKLPESCVNSATGSLIYLRNTQV